MSDTTKIVLDTSIFANPDANKYFGGAPLKSWEFFLEKAPTLKKIKFYMPPTVYEELAKFLEINLEPEKSLIIEKRPPASYETTIPALFVYELIDELRNRINKGLRIGEKFTRKGLKGASEEELVKDLRDEYRVALREGFLDSKSDFDLILLAKELNASIATADQGLIKWAAKLGIPSLTAAELKETLNR